MNTTKAAIYCRVASTNPQDAGVMENQIKNVRTFAEQQGFTDLTEYCDNGYGGNLFNRPAFIQLDADIENGKINTVIVRSIDRIARDFMLCDTWIDSLKSRNVKIITMDGSHEFPKINLDVLKSYIKTSASNM